MAGKSGTLTVRVISDTKAAERGLDKFSTKVQSTGDKMESAGKKMTLFATVPIVGAMGMATKAASDLEQAVGGTEAVFGDASGAVDSFAKKAPRAIGLTEAEFRVATTSIGGQLKRMTGDVDLAAERSVELTGVAADLAATYGGTTAEAVQALGAAFRGEADPAERFNLNLKIGAVNAKAVEMGLAATTSEVSESAKAQATYALIMEQSADAQGQFARESDSAAGSMQIAKAEMGQAAAEIGASLLPAVSKVAGGVADMAAVFGDLPEPVQNGVLALAGLIAVSGPVLTAAGRVANVWHKVGPAFDKAAVGAYDASGKIGTLTRTVGGVALGVGAIFAVKAGLDALGLSAKGLELDIAELAKTTTGELVEGFRELSEFDTSLARDAFRDLADEGYGTAVRLRDGMREAGMETEAYDRILEQSAEGQRRAAEDADATAEALDGQGEASDRASTATEKHASAMSRAEAAAARLEGMIGRVSDANERLFGVHINAEQAVIRSEAAYDQLTATIAENGTTMDVGSEKGRANREAILGAADAALSHVQALRDQGASTDAVNWALASHVGRLKDTMRQAGLTEDEINNYISTLGLTPDNVNTVVQLQNVAGAEQQIQNLTRPRTVDVHFRNYEQVFSVTGSNGATVRVRHQGGHANEGQAYLVGRPGHEELFMPDKSGRILSGHETDRAARRGSQLVPGGGGGGLVVNGNITFGSREDLHAFDFWARTQTVGI